MVDTNETQTRLIVLQEGEHLNSTVRKLEKGWKVRFVRGASLLGRDVSVRISLNGNTPLTWSKGSDHLSVYCEQECKVAGSFRYAFSVDKESEESGSGYLLVMPTLTVNDKVLPLDAISCQTHLTKLLGPLDEWRSRLQVSHESGYNMIHLTPIHQLGVSNSSYSLSDHHSLIQCLNRSSFADVDSLVKSIEKDWNILTVQDVVWNHAAKNAEWLQAHPESAYNCQNSPHLRPAYLVDRVYHHFGKEVGTGKWEHRGVPPVVNTIHHVNAINYLLKTEILPQLRLHEFFQCDVDAFVNKFVELSKGTPVGDPLDEFVPLVPDPEWRRFGCTVDWDLALKVFNRERSNSSSEEERISLSANFFRDHLLFLNGEGGKSAWDILMNGLEAVTGHITYERIADHGPKRGLVDEQNPLTTDYFLHLEADSSWEEEEKLLSDPEKAAHLMAFNGWVMCNDPLKNFALGDSQVYLRRQLVCWGDSVKLNYGEKPEDSPFLWNYMEEYTIQCAKIFHGLRIDNAHGTPIHVAEHLLKSARKIRPDLYVFAELFTGSEELDNLFVNRLGISSLIREAQSANDSHEQGRLVYRYGGDCVGAMIQKSVRLAPASVAHGLFLDQSHDNPTPIETRSVFDLMPTAAMISMASCAVGSTRGYDELVPHAIHVVEESRPYGVWGTDVNESTGIIAARKILNDLHTSLAQEGYSQVFVDQMSPDVVGITRHNPVTHSTVVVVSHTTFNKHSMNNGRVHLRTIPIGGVLDEVLFEMRMESLSIDHSESQTCLLGLSNHKVSIRQHIAPSDPRMCVVHGANGGHIELTDFPAGSVIGFKVRLSDVHQNGVSFIRNNILCEKDSSQVSNELGSCLSTVTLQNFNRILFCCEGEEQENIQQGGYDIPNFGKLVYCGFEGLMPVLKHIRENNDLGHPLCANLRDGTWLPTYIVARLTKYHGLEQLSKVVEKLMKVLDDIPYYLRPCYFECIVSFLHKKIRRALLYKLSDTFPTSSTLFRALVVSSVSFVGYVPSAGLSPLPASIQLPDAHPSSLAAGLPHFATGIWRNWGRDTFIALPGCLLTTQRYEDARNIILSFAGSLRHGLIPNLLAEGIGARYNCRDAVWFWLMSIVRYVERAGPEILNDTVLRIYPEDDTIYGQGQKEQPLIDVMVEALQKHFSGISYRERNAGHSIDEHMKDEGFNVEVWVDRTTGLIHGGNKWNCGTWMDKMGSSEKAGNRGEPATPRDGAVVELQALAAATLTAMSDWFEQKLISVDGVSHDNTKWTWKEWAYRIQNSFEDKFFVSADCKDEFVNKRNIVKDTFGSTAQYTDYQLRCNFVIALATQPKIMDPKNAWEALNMAKEHLLGPLGIKTLDPSDWAYNGFYNNDDDGIEKKTAKGWNYHQGPEWVWVAGFYLKARLLLGKELGGAHLATAVREVQSRLGNYYQHIQNSPWYSLPELTQEGGIPCPASCPAQAWSVGCVLEVCELLKTLV